MKNLILIFISCIIIYLMSTSCEEMFGDFLDKAPSVDVTEDTIFSSQTQVEMFVAGMYTYGIVFDWYHWHAVATGLPRQDGHTAGACDEGEIVYPGGSEIVTVTPVLSGTVMFEIVSVRIRPVPFSASAVAPDRLMSASVSVAGSESKFMVSSVVVTVPGEPFAVMLTLTRTGAR